MWRWAIELPKTRRARRAASALIGPLVARSRARLGAIDDATWSNPYIIGFMAMLITIIARMEAGKISDHALCLVQTQVWDDITARSGTIGEDVLLLSSARHRDFENGCRNAAAFASLLANDLLPFGKAHAERQEQPFDMRNAIAPSSPEDRDDITTAWEQFFEAHATPGLPNAYTISGATAF